MLTSLTPLYAKVILLGSVVAPLGSTVPVNLVNSPGFSCQRIGLAMVYDQPTTAAKVLGRTQDFIAVTGREVNGFLPMITGLKVRGWVMMNQTYQGKSFDARPCRVQVQPNGQLLFEQP